MSSILTGFSARLFVALLAVAFGLGAAKRPVAAAPAAPRQTININREWRFTLGDVKGAEAPGFDDGNWPFIGLPHSFSIPYFAAGNAFYVGYGWYRKHLDLPTQVIGKRLFLDFDGAFQDAEIFLNGQKVGAHQGGYTGFEIDITGAAKVGDNVLAVRLNNLWKPTIAPRAGEHAFSGGLYRGVWLVMTNPVHVAWYGTFVTTPKVSKESATVNVKTEVVNDSGAPKSATVRTVVLDSDGKQVAAMASTQILAANGSVVFDQTSEPVVNPKLWSPEQPALYTVQITVLEGRHVVDNFTSPFGIRSIEFTADKGFFLNGEHRYFKGANVHQDHAGWGDAVTDAGFARDVKLMKDAGFDFIRGSHYPHSPAFAQACDNIGVLFWSENCFWGIGGFKPDGYWDCSAYPGANEAAAQKPFEESVKASLRDMIRIHRNHPSIIAWSMGNEAFFSWPDVMPNVRAFLKELVAYTHQLDPSRPAAIGGVQRGDLAKIGDVDGQNGDGSRMTEFLHNGTPNVVAEYGSVISDRPGEYRSNDMEAMGQAQGASPDRPYSWRFPWRSGESIWCGFDHGSIAGRKFGAMGLVDYFRLPKRSWYWYRNEYAHVPPPEWPKQGTPAGLKLEADKTTLGRVDGTDDTHLVVTIVDATGRPISNNVPVTLAVESGPGEFPTGPSITFVPDSDIPIRDGQAAIEFRSYYAGKTVIRATSPGLKDASITITSQGGPVYVPGKTPAVKPRLYRPVTEQSGSGTASTFGTDNPTRVSSQAAGHPGSLANDGNPETFWQATGAPIASWEVDLEKIVVLQNVALTFPEEGAWRYRVEVSEDGARWTLAVDQSHSAATSKGRSDSVAKHVTGRYVRVTLTGAPAGKPAAIAEFTATGRPAQ